MKDFLVIIGLFFGLCVFYAIANAVNNATNPNARQSATFKVVPSDGGRAIGASKGTSVTDAFQQTFDKLERQAIYCKRIETIDKYVSAMEEAVRGMSSRYPRYDLSSYRNRCAIQRSRVNDLIAQKKAASKSSNASRRNPGRSTQKAESVKPSKSPEAQCSSSDPAISENTSPSPAADSSPVQKPASVPESAPVRESVEAVKEKADDFLTHFFANYFSIVLTDGSFSDVDNLPSLFSQCLRNYDGYNQLNLKERFGVDPLEYMKMFIGDRYEPRMSSRRELEMRLGGIATKLGSVKERMEKLDSLLLRRLSEESQILVSELFRHPFDGYTLKEIEYCYNALKKSGRIVEFHIKKDTYIRLPQAANGGMYNKKPRVAGSESSERRETPFTKTDLIAFLDSKSMEYVDKTPSGGCFWILGGPNADSFIKEVVVDGAKPVYAKNAKALNNRPGWFIKLGQPGKNSVNQAAYANAQTQIH